MDRCVVLCCAWSPLKILKLWPQSQLQHRHFFWSGHLCCFLRVICQHLIRCSVEATAQLLFAKRHCLRGWICPIRSWCFWHSLGKFSEVSYVVIPNQFKSDQNLRFFHFFHFFPWPALEATRPVHLVPAPRFVLTFPHGCEDPVHPGCPSCQRNTMLSVKYRIFFSAVSISKPKKKTQKSEWLQRYQRSATISKYQLAKALRKANDSRRSRQLSPWGPPSKVRLHRKGPSPSAWHLTAGHEALKVYVVRLSDASRNSAFFPNRSQAPIVKPLNNSTMCH